MQMWVSAVQRLYCLPQLTTGAQLLYSSLESIAAKRANQICDSLSLGVRSVDKIQSCTMEILFSL